MTIAIILYKTTVKANKGIELALEYKLYLKRNTSNPVPALHEKVSLSDVKNMAGRVANGIIGTVTKMLELTGMKVHIIQRKPRGKIILTKKEREVL